MNRYMDILAYDRTAIEYEGQACNANVVCDSAGRWWVAAQVGNLTRHELR